MDSRFKPRFEGRPLTRRTIFEAQNVVVKLAKELEDARARGDVVAIQMLRQELLDARAWFGEVTRFAEEQMAKHREEHDAAVRELAELEREAEARRRNPPPGKRVVSADVNPYMNRIGMLLDEEDAKAIEEWELARQRGYSHPWEKDRKKIRWVSLAVVAIIIVALVIWLLS